MALTISHIGWEKGIEERSDEQEEATCLQVASGIPYVNKTKKNSQGVHLNFRNPQSQMQLDAIHANDVISESNAIHVTLA